jgi:hypothetical protein
MSDQEIFLAACLEADPWTYIAAAVARHRLADYRQGISDGRAAADSEIVAPVATLRETFHGLMRRGVWHPSDKCRYCSQPIEREQITITYGYHLGSPAGDWYPSHKACRADGEMCETIFWQEADTACNDCLYFERGAMEEQSGYKKFRGTCRRDGHAVTTIPNQCQPENLECFYNRKRGKNPTHPLFAKLDAMTADEHRQ